MRVLALTLALIAATALNGQVRVDPEGDWSFLKNIVRMEGSYLGLRLSDIDADRARALKLDEPRGVEATKVEEGSPAEKAGIKTGDVLLTYNGENVLGAQQLGRLVRETPIGRRVKIQVWRDGRTQTITATTEAAPGRDFNFPVDVRQIHFPNVRGTWIEDIPTPLLLWNSMSLGVECEEVNAQLADYFGVKHGMLVRSISKGSAAEKAGLRAGDILVSIGDRPITSQHDLTGFLRTQQEPGKTIPLVVMRDHRQLTINVVPNEQPE